MTLKLTIKNKLQTFKETPFSGVNPRTSNGVHRESSSSSHFVIQKYNQVQVQMDLFNIYMLKEYLIRSRGRGQSLPQDFSMVKMSISLI